MPYLSAGVSRCCRTKWPPAINANQPWRFVQLFCGIMINAPLKSLLVFPNMCAWRIFRNIMGTFPVNIPKSEHEHLTQGNTDFVHWIMFFPYPRNFPRLTELGGLCRFHSRWNWRVTIQRSVKMAADPIHAKEASPSFVRNDNVFCNSRVSMLFSFEKRFSSFCKWDQIDDWNH